MQLYRAREDLQKHVDVVDEELLQKFLLLLIHFLLVLLRTAIENLKRRKLITI